MNKQIIPVVDKNDRVIAYKDRSQIRAGSDIYRVASLMILDSRERILLAKRAAGKSHDPGCWAPPVNGTIEKGESYRRNIFKETQEELGIRLDYARILGKSLMQYEYSHFTTRYLLVKNLDIGEIKCDPGEISELRWFSAGEMFAEYAESPEKFVKSFPYFLKFFQPSAKKQRQFAVRYIVANKQDELLDVLVEYRGRSKNPANLILVHGLGTDKHENGLFADISAALNKQYQIIRFDFSGFGVSEGHDYDGNYEKFADDLQSVIAFVKTEFSGELNILAHSMGTFVTAWLSPEHVRKTVLTGIPNASTDYITSRLAKRIADKGGQVNFRDITIYPRTSGKITELGKKFWLDLHDFQPEKSLTNLAAKTQLIIIHPLQDEIVGNDFLEPYRQMKNTRYIEVNGSHGFSGIRDRNKFLNILREIFAQ